MPENWTYLSARVDEPGYLIPYEQVMLRLSDTADSGTISELVNRPFGVSTQKTSYYYLYGSGEMSPKLKEQYKACGENVLARRNVLVPTWLGENPPYHTVFLPDGRIMAYGELGLTYEPDADQDEFQQRTWWPQYECWYIYSADGRLEGRSQCTEQSAFGSWLYALNPGLKEQIDDKHRKLDEQNADGHIYTHHLAQVITLAWMEMDDPAMEMYLPPEERTERKVLAAWDWQGNPLEADAVITNDLSYCQPVDRAQLSKRYERQVEQGLVDPDEKSPYAGTPEGPQAVDSAPRPRPFFAQARGPEPQVVRVQPIDDPKNPFAGQYDDWDLWIYENRGRQNKQLHAEWNQQHREKQKQIKELVEAGEEIPAELLQPQVHTPSPDDPWKTYFVEVTSDGWQIPARLIWQEEAELKYAKRDLRDDSASSYRQPGPAFSSGGEMPAEMKAQMDAAEYALMYAQCPPIPGWLAAAPAARVIFIPNGEIVTMGPLGSYDPEHYYSRINDLPEEIRGWYRYSPGGELLDQYMHQGYDWERLYHDEREFLKTDAQARGEDCTERDGYLIIRKSADGPVTAIYDYDGTPCPVDQPLYRDPDYCNIRRWPDLRPGAASNSQ